MREESLIILFLFFGLATAANSILFLIFLQASECKK